MFDKLRQIEERYRELTRGMADPAVIGDSDFASNAASGIAGLSVTLLMRTRIFSAAAQLTLRPGEQHHPPPYRLANLTMFNT